MSMLEKLRKFIQDDSGVPAIELIFIAPILLTIFVGAYEINRVILLNKKLYDAAHTIASEIAVTTPLRERAVATTQRILVDGHLAAFEYHQQFQGTESYFISGAPQYSTTALSREGARNARIRWQVKNTGANPKLGNSGRVGRGKMNSLLPGYYPSPDTSVVITEIEYTYRPVFLPNDFFEFLMGQQTVSKAAVATYRFGRTIPDLS